MTAAECAGLQVEGRDRQRARQRADGRPTLDDGPAAVVGGRAIEEPPRHGPQPQPGRAHPSRPPRCCGGWSPPGRRPRPRRSRPPPMRNSARLSRMYPGTNAVAVSAPATPPTSAAPGHHGRRGAHRLGGEPRCGWPG